MNTATFDDLLRTTQHGSRYAKHLLTAEPELLQWLRGNYATPCTGEEIQMWLQSGFDLSDEAQLSSALRKVRKQVMLKLILRDLNGLADLFEVMHAMTALAEVCLQQAQDFLMQSLQAQFGQPIGEASKVSQELLVIGMGKLGGGELNVSSDIDLIFVYPEDGETNGERTLSNHEFFTRLGRRLINLINELTADGYVFRVDMRLRPYGDSGPLVASFAALEEYLISQGRAWERYAWVKARVVTLIDKPTLTELTKLVQPFVYRKYLDFGAIDSMRLLHAQIRQEIQRRDRLNNIKLGPGGIREIEFIAQVFQLIRGGGNAKLRIRATQSVLQQLSLNGQLPAPVVTDLNEAYIFLRNLEHRLQYLDDQQTQELPDKTEDQNIIAAAMGYAKYDQFLNDLNQHREIVSVQFEKIFGAQPDTQNDSPLWGEGIMADVLTSHLSKLGYRTANESTQRLIQLRESNRYRQLPEQSKQRLDKLIPSFIQLSSQHSNPDTTLSRLLTLLEGISRRAAYLAFLAEYPQTLTLLTRLVAASSWAADYMTQHPALLDELLDAREIYQPPQWQQFDQHLQTRLDDCAEDVERQLDVLRNAQQEQTFHLLAMDLQGLLPLEILSDHISELADLILRHVLKLCWDSARKKHRVDAKFAIIAYGKLGGKELGYASDLDIIFLYDDDHPDAQENYSRLAQRINTMLGSYTSSGRLYETDLRLRPNGESGLLVSSIAAFAEYQKEHAWVWEHQALTRARFSAGDMQIGKQFESIRQQVLCQARELPKLRDEILSMRQKMQDGHPNDSGLFDIKHDTGGMVDIEFIVQYIILAHAHQHPQLAENIGNLALLKLAGELGIIPIDIAEHMRNLYRQLRQTQHRMRLNNQTVCRIEPSEINVSACKNLWGNLFGES
ncbi:MAG: bifunctional [glutamate--ammonia ligase]-adenylyl-L-tyrosine phosphorylase/[glutamate--ammonia-ligase] adenylyltransferase [Gallionella sp.]|nr:bifunctional [glutamate--ammonia ligase]-adenylyl-L-tyrosine phosphorylase/[glutamate--ammonia-ligase] adenylyltransferase [Gallionella sp.]